MSKDKFQDFVPYEQSLALRELGFDEPCLAGYSNSTEKLEFYSRPLVTKDSFTVDAPTFSQAFRFFREKYGLHQVVLADVNGKYDIIVGERISGSCLGQYETYEEAELECLKKLIEIVNNKYQWIKNLYPMK